MSKYDKKKVSAMVNNNERLFRPTQIVQERVYSNTLNRNGSVFRIIQDDRVVEVIVKLNTPKLCSYNEYGDESTAKIPLTILLNDEEVIKDEWDGHVRSYSKSYTIKRKEPGIMRITVRRDSPDNDDSRVQDSLFWESYTEVVNSNGSDTNIVSVEIATCDSDNGWNGTSILFECNYNTEELVNCYSEGCDKLGFDPIDSYGPSPSNKATLPLNYASPECNKVIPSDKIEELRQVGCDLFCTGDPVRIYPPGWAELFMWIAKYGDSSLTYTRFDPASVTICNGNISYSF